MGLIKIKLNELGNFCNSNLFQSFSVKPISPLRVKSYLGNPRANPNDTVLYMYVENGELIAFRTILSDSIDNINFGWCSGNWVNPAFRGKKISVKLFNEVAKDWENRLMFTNYAPASEHNYINTKQFKILKYRTGRRFYLYPNFSEILKGRKTILSPILPLLSALTGSISFLKSLFTSNKLPKFKELETLDDDCREILRNSAKTFFNRKETELDWIINFPWITPEKHSDFVYPFSYSEINYSLKIVKIYDADIFAGFFVYTILNAKMKIIYHFVEDEIMDLLLNVVATLARRNKISYLTILEPALAMRFQKIKHGFAFSKQANSHIYSSLNIENNQHLTIFDGDGDNAFT